MERKEGMMKDSIDKLSEDIVKLFPNRNGTDFSRRRSDLFDTEDKANHVARMIRDAGIEVWQAMRDDEDADKFTEKIIELEKELKEI
jgi:6-phosphofructokinase